MNARKHATRSSERGWCWLRSTASPARSSTAMIAFVRSVAKPVVGSIHARIAVHFVVVAARIDRISTHSGIGIGLLVRAAAVRNIDE